MLALEELANRLDSRPESAQITGVTTDSRLVEKGDLFIACEGSKHDGASFIDEAKKRGAAAFIAKTNVAGYPTIIHPNPREIVSKIGDIYFDSPTSKLLTIGVTGTNGKTTTTNLISQLIDIPHTLIGTLGTFLPDGSKEDIGLTTPDPLYIQKIAYQTLKFGGKALIMEVSSHALHQGRVSGIKFDGAIFTNLTQDHLDYHSSMEEYFLSKAKLFSLLKPAGKGVVFIEDSWGERLLERYPGIIQITNDSYKLISQDLKGSKFEYKERNFFLPIVGEFNVKNALLSLVLLESLGVKVESLDSLRPIKGRLEVVVEDVFVDYSHTPDSLEKAITELKKLTDKPLTVVFGCGGDRDKTKRPLMGEIASRLADKVIITSDNPRTEDPNKIIDDILKGSKKDLLVIEDREKAITKALEDRDSVVLIAGKGHEEYQIVGTEKRYFSDQEVVRRVRGKFGSTRDNL